MYGSIATPLAKKNEDQHTHKWSIYVRGINNEDISYFVKSVTFRLHESFAQPNRRTFLSLFAWLLSDLDRRSNRYVPL